MPVFRKTRLHRFFYPFILQDNRKRKEPGRIKRRLTLWQKKRKKEEEIGFDFGIGGLFKGIEKLVDPVRFILAGSAPHIRSAEKRRR